MMFGAGENPTTTKSQCWSFGNYCEMISKYPPCESFSEDVKSDTKFKKVKDWMSIISKKSRTPGVCRLGNDLYISESKFKKASPVPPTPPPPSPKSSWVDDALEFNKYLFPILLLLITAVVVVKRIRKNNGSGPPGGSGSGGNDKLAKRALEKLRAGEDLSSEEVDALDKSLNLERAELPAKASKANLASTMLASARGYLSRPAVQADLKGIQDMEIAAAPAGVTVPAGHLVARATTNNKLYFVPARAIAVPKIGIRVRINCNAFRPIRVPAL